MIQLQAADAAAMDSLGANLGRALNEGAVVYLRGQLGAGKTTLVRGVLHGLGFAGQVRSPTYTLVEGYEIGEHRLYITWTSIASVARRSSNTWGRGIWTIRRCGYLRNGRNTESDACRHPIWCWILSCGTWGG